MPVWSFYTWNKGGASISWACRGAGAALGPFEGILWRYLGIADVRDPGRQGACVQASTSPLGSAPSSLASTTIIPNPRISEAKDPKSVRSNREQVLGSDPGARMMLSVLSFLKPGFTAAHVNEANLLETSLV